MLGEPTTCPHGNPIPGSDYIAPDVVPLADVDVGSEFTVRRIPEELEFTPGLLEFLEARHPSGLQRRRSPPPRPTARSRSRSTVTTWGSAPFASARILVIA